MSAPTFRDWVCERLDAAFRTRGSAMLFLCGVVLWIWAIAYGLELIRPVVLDIGLYWLAGAGICVAAAAAFSIAEGLVRSVDDQVRLEIALRWSLHCATWLIVGAMLKAFGKHAAELYETFAPAPAWLYSCMDVVNWIAPAALGGIFYITDSLERLMRSQPAPLKVPPPNFSMRN
ncbi:MAG TPA: hypothetical protein VHE61_20365 [Opitutaceae bacterium]|nr:hypothetical protein [Opitutaceae bacterium]